MILYTKGITNQIKIVALIVFLYAKQEVSISDMKNNKEAHHVLGYYLNMIVCCFLKRHSYGDGIGLMCSHK